MTTRKDNRFARRRADKATRRKVLFQPGDKLRFVLKQQAEGLGMIFLTMVFRNSERIFLDATFLADTARVYFHPKVFDANFRNELWWQYPAWFREQNDFLLEEPYKMLGRFFLKDAVY